MERYDLYTPPRPFNANKWLAFAFSGLFGAIAIGAGALTLTTLRQNGAVAGASVSPVGALVANGTTPTPVQAPTPGAELQAPLAAAATQTASATNRSSAPSKSTRAKRQSRKAAVSGAKARSILAKHETPKNKRKRDEIDRLLGL